MREILTQHPGFALALLASPFVPIVVLFFLLRRRLRREVASEPSAPTSLAEPALKLDSAALSEAIHDAETRGEKGRLPGLYLALAQCHITAGATADAEALLRKSILGAAGAELKETHAKARVALGDIAHKSGDLTTACEHWQIARALFHELKQTREHEVVEQRMLRNGCPTDWVLTDF